MRFKEFLLEQDGVDLAAAYKKIKSDCGYFLHEAKNVPLYRGMHVVSEKMIYQKQPEGRKPKDSDPGFNFAFNAGAELAFGHKEIRQKSLYVTGSSVQASQYGQLYYAFPLGENFKFLSSYTIEDSYEDSDKMFDRVSDSFKKYTKTKLYSGALAEIFQTLASETTLDKWLTEDGEQEHITQDAIIDHFVLSSESGRAILNSGKLIKWLKGSLEESFTEEYRDSEDFKRALESKCEIGIYEGSGCYLLPINAVADQLVSDMSSSAIQMKKALGLNPREIKYHTKELYEYVLQHINAR
jgi:hypothetical protein